MIVNQKRLCLWKRMLFCMVLVSGWIFFSCPVKASQLYFPYYADSWPQIDTGRVGIALLQDTSRKQETSDKNEQQKKEEDSTKKEKASKDALSNKDREILYKVVSMECDTGYEGSLAVISCMLNRQASGKYPDDLMDVVREDSQFTAYYDKETGTYPYVDREPSEECIAAVNDALEKGKRNIPSYIYYFRSSDYDYLNGYITYGQIGDNTYFYQYEDQ